MVRVNAFVTVGILFGNFLSGAEKSSSSCGCSSNNLCRSSFTHAVVVIACVWRIPAVTLCVTGRDFELGNI